LIRVEFVDCALIFELLGFLIIGLTSNNQNSVFVPWQMNGYKVAHEWELLVGLQIDDVPAVAFNDVSLDGVNAL